MPFLGRHEVLSAVAFVGKPGQVSDVHHVVSQEMRQHADVAFHQGKTKVWKLSGHYLGLKIAAHQVDASAASDFATARASFWLCVGSSNIPPIEGRSRISSVQAPVSCTTSVGHAGFEVSPWVEVAL